MHEIRTVRCPKCGAEVQVFDTDQRASCPKCGTSFTVPSILEEKLAKQAKEAMEKSVAEIKEENDLQEETSGKEKSGRIHKIFRIILYAIVLVVALCILLMMSFSHTVH